MAEMVTIQADEAYVNIKKLAGAPIKLVIGSFDWTIGQLKEAIFAKSISSIFLIKSHDYNSHIIIIIGHEGSQGSEISLGSSGLKLLCFVWTSTRPRFRLVDQSPDIGYFRREQNNQIIRAF